MANKLVYNFSAAFIANIVNLLVTVFVTLFVPRYSGVQDYSQWQLYLFYVSYLWIIGFGWPDGVYLRYGGMKYETIDKCPIKAQYVLVCIYLAVILPVLALLSLQNNNYLVFLFVLLDSAIEIPRETCMKLLQATNRTVEYSKILIFSRLLFLISIFLGTVTGNVSFVYMAAMDVGTKAIGLLLALCFCKDILLSSVKAPKTVWKQYLTEFKEVVSGGSKLMLGNLCAMFIVGIVRLAIENQWGLVAFGKVSLTLSISNLFNVFISAVSLVLFPALKNLEAEMLKKTYVVIEETLMISMFGLLILYYPVKQILDFWLPQYSDGLRYMAILFPVCVYQSKTSLLANTYQKALRQEKWIFIVNTATLALSALLTIITVYVLKSLDAAVFSIVVLLVFRNIISEFTVWKALQFNRGKHVVGEIILTGVFIISSWFIGGLKGLALYFVVYLVYLLIKRKDVAFVVNAAVRVLRRK